MLSVVDFQHETEKYLRPLFDYGAGRDAIGIKGHIPLLFSFSAKNSLDGFVARSIVLCPYSIFVIVRKNNFEPSPVCFRTN